MMPEASWPFRNQRWRWPRPGRTLSRPFSAPSGSRTKERENKTPSASWVEARPESALARPRENWRFKRPATRPGRPARLWIVPGGPWRRSRRRAIPRRIPKLQAAILKASAEVVDATHPARRGKKATAQRRRRPPSKRQRPLTRLDRSSFTAPRRASAIKPSNKPYATVSTGRRLALARWIVDRRNPLTARVAVNHIWMRHFGEPLVASTFDFGLRTQRPVHHELLDWLAVEFMESGWSMKHLHRLIVTSQAYRMQSAGGPAEAVNARIDPDNHYLWRMNVRRMEAEVIRDSLLHLAGRLDSRMGGPDLPVASAETVNRRSIYYRYARGDRIPFLVMFDAPSVEECYRRDETIVPQQALALINSGVALARAAEIAAVIDKEVGASDTPGGPVRLRGLGFRASARPGADRRRAGRMRTGARAAPKRFRIGEPRRDDPPLEGTSGARARALEPQRLRLDPVSDRYAFT